MFSASKTAAPVSAGGYTIGNSLRFRSSASAYLNRTPASAGNRQTWTWSGWVKRGKLGVENALFHAPGTIIGVAHTFCYFTASDTLAFYDYTGSAYNFLRTSTQVFRDPSAWYHLVFVVDSNNATAQNRARIYVNGAEITSWSSNSTGSSGFNTIWNSAVLNEISSSAILPTTYYLDGYLAEINFIDGQALTPSSFGAFNPITGVWQPKQYSGTYGTNGFKLNFSNGTSTTTLGYDSSGNGNNWTTNNISLTAGSTYDWMLDSPTPYAGTSYGVGNYAVLNPLNRTGSTYSTSQGNLVWSGSSTALDRIYGSIGVASSKWYWEVTVQSLPSGIYNFIGVSRGYSSTSNYDNTALCYIGVPSDPSLNGYFQNRNIGATTAYGSGYGAGDVIGVALDMDTGALTFYKNGVSQGVAISTINSSYPGTYYPMFFPDGSGSGSTVAFNFGQRPFAYSPPSGYKALCTYNLPTPTIQNGAGYMAATTYTGNGATQSIVNAVNGVSFQPDWVWVKNRTSVSSNDVYDSIRGATNLLYTNGTAAEQSYSGVTAFNSNGFSLGSAGGDNASGNNFVGWQWKAGGTAVTNTAGSITSSVSANTTAGFSVVTYTGTGANATVGHGLGVAPSMIINKSRNAAQNWTVFHAGLANMTTAYVRLNTTDAAGTLGNAVATPTSTTFGISASTADTSTYVAYCFAAISGYSAFGSYTGNGSTDGPFVFTGMRSRFILIKRTDSAANWRILDTSRDVYNVESQELYPNLSNAEGTFAALDGLSNGFKLRNSDTAYNASGGTYIYAAFAENPFQNALAR